MTCISQLVNLHFPWCLVAPTTNDCVILYWSISYLMFFFCTWPLCITCYSGSPLATASLSLYAKCPPLACNNFALSYATCMQLYPITMCLYLHSSLPIFAWNTCMIVTSPIGPNQVKAHVALVHVCDQTMLRSTYNTQHIASLSSFWYFHFLPTMHHIAPLCTR